MQVAAKIAISLPVDLLEEIDKLVKEQHQSRSAIVRLAINNLVKSYLEHKAFKRARQIYKDIAETDRKLSKEFISISKETLPSRG